MKSERSRSVNRAGGSFRPTTPLLVAALVAVALACAAVFGLTGRTASPRPVNFTEIVRIAEGHAARSVRVEGDQFLVIMENGETLAAVVDDAAARHDLAARFASAEVP